MLSLPVAAGGSLLVIVGAGEIGDEPTAECLESCGGSPGRLIGMGLPIVALSLSMLMHGLYTAIRQPPPEA